MKNIEALMKIGFVFKSLFFLILFTATSVSATTKWIPNASLTEATLSPSPYTNNSDDTQVLTISGATTLDVSIKGKLERHSRCAYDYITVRDSAGVTSQKYCGNINNTFSVTGPSVTLIFHSDYSVTNTGATVTISTPNRLPSFTSTPPSTINENATYSYVPATNDPDGDPVTVSASQLPGWLTFDGTTLLGTPQASDAGTHSVTLSANDGRGGITTQNFTISVIPVSNIAPTFTSTPIISATKNTSYSYTVTTNDLNGDTVTVTAKILPPWATFNGTTLTGTPTSDGTYTVTLVANDGHGLGATQTFDITVTSTTIYKEGRQNFKLINPASTRNILGNFATLGNTVECITEKRGTSVESDSYNGNCQNSTAFNDNNYMAKYIDIDNDSKTWNSSSSNFTLPDTYDKDGGKGILWAGLFWQGSINNSLSYKQRRAYLSGGSIAYHYVNSYQSIDLKQTDGNKVLLKINNGSYQDIKAQNFYYDKAFGSYGGYYAAYADVTSYLHNANLDGNTTHTLSIANITANEGRQQGIGNYAGWSIIVIYKESPGQNVKAKNISIYDGYTIIPSSSSVEISGFKLPSSGTVNAQFTAFAGEGEHIYGGSSYRYDRMIISPNSTLSPSDTMPQAIDSNNIFDAILANIDRDSGNDNEMTGNNNGIDIDNYDVSTIMTNYRNNNDQIDTVYIGLSSNNDYITPSMMAFSADLYKPKICYDYTIQKDKFDITEDNRTVTTRTSGDVSINLAIESLEGDFDLTNTQVGLTLTPLGSNYFTDAYYAPNGVNTFLPAIYIDNNTSRPLIAIGEQISTSGGTVKKGQRYFSKFVYHIPHAYSGSFDVTLTSTVDYGSGAVPNVQTTRYNEIPRCPQSDVYNPEYGTFNIERVESGNFNSLSEPEKRFPLYTQIVGKDFDVHVVAYDGNTTPPYINELPLSGYTVDLELINAKPFNDDKARFICNNPDASIIKDIMPGENHRFVTFPSSATSPKSRIDLSNDSIQTDTALRNAAFRIWYLVDANNTILPHECPNLSTAVAQESCFENLYQNHLQATDTALRADGTIGYCQTECTNGGSDCYQCLRSFHARAICSRDNFSIRPVSYRMKISDNNESQVTGSPKIELANNENNTGSRLAAGYNYKIDGQSTSYIANTIALGYTRSFNTVSSTDIQSVLSYNMPTTASCADMNDTFWEVHFENGTINGTDNLFNHVKHSNVGNYQYQIQDLNWTLVDQQRYIYKTFPGVSDCTYNSHHISPTKTGMHGCSIDDSNVSANGSNYQSMNLTYYPYKFDIRSVVLNASPQTSANYVFMNNYDNTYYDDPLLRPLTMSALFSGSVTARAKDDIITTNFQTGCISTSVSINLERTMNPAEGTIMDSNLSNVPFQQYLQESNATVNNPVRAINKITSIDGNTTLSDASFTQPGFASIRLHTNLKKPLDETVNPVDINYTELKITSDDAFSYAGLKTHIPDGNNTYNQVFNFYFAKITPEQKYYDDIVENWKKTAIMVDIYCYDLANPTLCANFNLNTLSKAGEQGWYAATMFDGDNSDGITDGTTDLFASTPFGLDAGPKVDPVANVQFQDENGTRDDINVSVTGNERPTVVDIRVEGVPWLIYDKSDPSGYPHYRLRFIGPSIWIGVGNRGEVSEAASSSSTTKRMNW